MGGPAFPSGISKDRWPHITFRSIIAEKGLSPDSFVFMEDTEEWIAESKEDAELIRAAYPDAKILVST